MWITRTAVAARTLDEFKASVPVLSGKLLICLETL